MINCKSYGYTFPVLSDIIFQDIIWPRFDRCCMPSSRAFLYKQRGRSTPFIVLHPCIFRIPSIASKMPSDDDSGGKKKKKPRLSRYHYTPTEEEKSTAVSALHERQHERKFTAISNRPLSTAISDFSGKLLTQHYPSNRLPSKTTRALQIDMR